MMNEPTSETPPNHTAQSTQSTQSTDWEKSLPRFGASAPENNAWGDALLGGCVGGILLNMVLGFLVLMLARGGVVLYGPGVLVIVAALLLLAVVAREWSRRALLGIVGVLLGMGLSFVALKIFVEPMLRPVSSSNATSNEGRPFESAPQDESGAAS